MLWVLKRTVSIRRFFWAPKTRVQTGHPNYRQEPTRADKNRQEAFYILIH